MTDNKIVSINGQKIDQEDLEIDNTFLLFQDKESLRNQVNTLVDEIENVENIDCFMLIFKDINGSIKNHNVYINPLSAAGVLDVIKNRILFG